MTYFKSFQQGLSRRRLIITTGSAAAAAGAAFSWWRSKFDSNAEIEDFWDLVLPRPDGSELRLSDFRLRGLVLNFWATWCPPCVREMPMLNSLHQRWRRESGETKGWQILGIAVDEPDSVSKFTQTTAIRFDLAVAGADGIAQSRRLGNKDGGLPFTAVFAPGGKLVATLIGEAKEDQLLSIVAKHS